MRCGHAWQSNARSTCHRSCIAASRTSACTAAPQCPNMLRVLEPTCRRTARAACGPLTSGSSSFGPGPGLLGLAGPPSAAEAICTLLASGRLTKVQVKRAACPQTGAVESGAWAYPGQDQQLCGVNSGVYNPTCMHHCTSASQALMGDRRICCAVLTRALGQVVASQ